MKVAQLMILNIFRVQLQKSGEIALEIEDIAVESVEIFSSKSARGD
jgi:hypothetical protein